MTAWEVMGVVSNALIIPLIVVFGILFTIVIREGDS